MDPRDYVPEEVEHFNAYALSRTIRNCSLRAIGMMFATEFLVPQQLAAVIAGWTRVGLRDAKMKYIIDHQEGDVDHANGWAEHVVRPLIDMVPNDKAEIYVGVMLHLDILGRLYDKIYSAWTASDGGALTRRYTSVGAEVKRLANGVRFEYSGGWTQRSSLVRSRRCAA